MKFSLNQEINNIASLRALNIEMDAKQLDSILIRSEYLAVQEDQDFWKKVKESLTLYILDHKQNSNFTEKLSNPARARRLIEYMTLIDVMVGQLKGRASFLEQLNSYAETLFSPEFPSCGNNSFWGVSAWYVGINTPLEEDGDLYIIDHEDGKYSITRRNYIGDGDTEQVDLITVDLNQARNIEEGREMLNLLGHSGTYIVHNL